MSMLSLRSHVPDDVIAAADRLPGQADVVVIGGGIIGAAAAFHLAGAGLSTVLLEADKVSSQQSGRNCRTIDCNKRAMFASTGIVDALGKQFFA